MREFNVVPENNLYKVVFAKGGEIAHALKGLYSSEKKAWRAIDVYMVTKLPKKRKNKATAGTYAHKRIGELSAKDNS